MKLLLVVLLVVAVAAVVLATFLTRRLDRVRKRLDAVKAERQRKIREGGLPAELAYAVAQIDREIDALRSDPQADRDRKDRLDELRSIIVRVHELQTREFDVVPCCVEAVADWRRRNPGREIRFESTDDTGPLFATGDDELFRWTLDELFDNVNGHAGEWSRITMKLEPADGGASLHFEDDGEGPDLMTVSRFYGAFTPRVESDGPGLGLFAARAILDRMGGSIHASPGSEGGLAHTLRFPVTPSRPALTTATETAALG